ncbi:MAG TPA: protease pro-enzyme activation domain-containing protein, partial [Acidimicrobiales bacterium]|nr:protease pro-enzyme activation domain-containing protein [Acidimicrobiales bacterium]
MRGTLARSYSFGDTKKPRLATIWRLVAVSAAVAAVAAAAPAGGLAVLPSVRLTASTSAVGNAAVAPVGTADLGPAPASQRLALDVVLAPRDPAALSRFALAVSTPGNPLYGHYLKTGQFPTVFGPTAATISKVMSGLRRLGLEPGAISSNHLIIPVSATVATVEHALGVSLDRYRLSTGRRAIANVNAPRLPSSFARAVTAVIGLDNLVENEPADLGAVPPAAGKPATSGRPGAASGRVSHATGPQACSAASSFATKEGAWTENELAKAYSLPTLYTRGDLGQGATIAIFEATAYDSSDITAFQQCYKTNTSVKNISVDGGTTSTAGLGEAELDIETIIGIVPKASLLVYEAPNSGTGTIDEYNAIVSQNKAQVMSSSWGLCEVFLGSSASNAQNTIFEQAASQGQSMLAVPGDEGSEGCLPNDFGAGGAGLGSSTGPLGVAV